MHSNLFCVEIEFRLEKLGNLHCDQDAAEQEDHRVGDSRDEYGQILRQSQWPDESPEAEWLRINASERNILVSEIGSLTVDVIPEEACFWPEEDVEDELDTIDLQQMVINKRLPVDAGFISLLWPVSRRSIGILRERRRIQISMAQQELLASPSPSIFPCNAHAAS